MPQNKAIAKKIRKAFAESLDELNESFLMLSEITTAKNSKKAKEELKSIN